MSELKPCPFCGSNRLHEFSDKYFKWVACDNCHSNSPCGETPFYWNDRYIEDALKQRIAELEQENTRLRKERRWIPVSERLPEEYACSVSVLVFRNGYTVAVAWYDFEEENWHKSNAIGMLIDGVTHWMPLPPPPEAEC